MCIILIACKQEQRKCIEYMHTTPSPAQGFESRLVLSLCEPGRTAKRPRSQPSRRQKKDPGCVRALAFYGPKFFLPTTSGHRRARRMISIPPQREEVVSMPDQRFPSLALLRTRLVVPHFPFRQEACIYIPYWASRLAAGTCRMKLTSDTTSVSRIVEPRASPLTHDLQSSNLRRTAGVR